MRTGLLVAAIALGSGMALARAGAEDASPDVHVQLDAERRQVVVTVGPIHVPEATGYEHHHTESRLSFDWPVRGWVRGYRIDLVDAQGRALPREMLHHAGVANPGRRQLAYPVAERLFAVGRETAPVMMPASLGVPMARDQRLILYYALVNATPAPVDGAVLRLTLAFTPDGGPSPTEVFPLVLDANPEPIVGGSRAFEVPAGVSVTSAELTLPLGGWLRAAGAHLHDYATEIRLEDVRTGRVLARLKTNRRADGRLVSVQSTRFLLKRHGLRLEANRPYRVLAVYDNPTGHAIPHGAMAYLAGPFIPDQPARWPALDAADASYQHDLEGR